MFDDKNDRNGERREKMMESLSKRWEKSGGSLDRAKKESCIEWAKKKGKARSTFPQWKEDAWAEILHPNRITIMTCPIIGHSHPHMLLFRVPFSLSKSTNNYFPKVAFLFVFSVLLFFFFTKESNSLMYSMVLCCRDVW